MNKIEKFLRRLSKKQVQSVLRAIDDIEMGIIAHLDVRKLTGYKNTYRARVGTFRIIFTKKAKTYKVIDVSKRSENTYK